jgi:hypothetical protein
MLPMMSTSEKFEDERLTLATEGARRHEPIEK